MHPDRRIALLALALAAPALAGCLAPPASEPLPAVPGLPVVVHLPGGLPAAPADLAGLVPLQAAWRLLGHDAVEPTLGITSDGTLFYAAAVFYDTRTGGRSIRTDVLRSRDGGLTWEDVSPRLPTGDNAPPTTGDPYVYVDPATDRVYTYDMFPGLVCGWLSWSDDQGDSWTSNPVGCATPPPYDHQTLAAGPPRGLATQGYPNVLYSCVNRITDSICIRSTDGGRTFVPGAPAFLGVDPSGAGPSTEAFFDTVCGGLHGHVVAAPDGTVYLPRTYCGAPMVGISQDDGTTWRQVLVADIPASDGPDPAVAVDDAGNVYYAFVDAPGRLLLAVSRDAGATWSEPLEVQAPAVTAAHLPAIAAGAEGRVAIAYAGTEDLPEGYENGDFQNQSSERADDGPINAATWNGYLAVIPDALAARPVIQTAMVNDPADPLVRGYCGPGRCPGMYDFIDVVVGPEGRPWAAFVDACTEDCAGPEGTFRQSQGANQSRAGALATLTSGPLLRDPAPAGAAEAAARGASTGAAAGPERPPAAASHGAARPRAGV